MTLEDRARRIRLVLFDVDGVLTDGVVVMHADGSESKGFQIKDGAAIVWAQRAGVQVGLLSARLIGRDDPPGGPARGPDCPAGGDQQGLRFRYDLEIVGAHGGSGMLHGR